ncbi:hypothetical protein J4H92_09495 [Leucobacter weissii]|uniref:Uncharacterized protein n=1 Tax=Leucobacter weissii TaxID=1983706 RepID=A0A939MSG8_9MICO|nr:DUF6350 family protein [Leucobacter weissii]MBO1902179.1 hypothetical protein [Leucobacter weissii]
MKAVVTAGAAAIEALAVALAAWAIIAVVGVLLWWLAFDLAAEPGDVVAGISAGWLLAHFVPLGFSLDADAALSLGLGGGALDFTLSLAPLGLTLLTVVLAFRAGRRFAREGAKGAAGVLGGAIGFAVAAGGIAVLASPLPDWPLWACAAVPALCYAASSGAGYLLHAATAGHAWWKSMTRRVQRLVEPFGELRASALPGRAAEVIRLAAASVAGLATLGALGFAVAVVVGYVDIVALGQGLHPDVLGLILLFLLNLVLLPVACVWGIAWFSGAGFAIGAGTSVTPFETLLGPLPAFPLLGAVPEGWGWAGGLAPAAVVLSAIAIGALAGARSDLRHSSLSVAIVVPLLAALLAGLAVAGLSALATGAAGPGRLAVVGPAPWLVGGLIALELGFGLVPGVLARRLDLESRREPDPEPNAFDWTASADEEVPSAGNG